MAYVTPASFAAGTTPTAVQMNVLRSDLEEVAKHPVGWVSSSVNQTVTNGSGPTVTFATTLALRNVTFASNTLTIVENGYYLGIVHVAWGSSTAGIRVCSLIQNGHPASEHITPGAATNWSQQTLAMPFVGGVGDAITAGVFQDSGGSLALLAGSSLFIHMLGRL